MGYGHEPITIILPRTVLSYRRPGCLQGEGEIMSPVCVHACVEERAYPYALCPQCGDNDTNEYSNSVSPILVIAT